MVEENKPIYWTRLVNNRKYLDAAEERVDELKQERIELILEGARIAPLSLLAKTLGLTRSRVSQIYNDNKGDDNADDLPDLGE